MSLTGVGGCSRPAHELDTAKVSGVVTLDGLPVTTGYVVALPSKGRMARAEIQPDGSFTFGTYSKNDGVQVGTHPVIVTPPPEDEGAVPIQGAEIPRKYSTASSSGLRIEVPSEGLSDYRIELTSGA